MGKRFLIFIVLSFVLSTPAMGNPPNCGEQASLGTYWTKVCEKGQSFTNCVYNTKSMTYLKYSDELHISNPKPDTERTRVEVGANLAEELCMSDPCTRNLVLNSENPWTLGNAKEVCSIGIEYASCVEKLNSSQFWTFENSLRECAKGIEFALCVHEQNVESSPRMEVVPAREFCDAKFPDRTSPVPANTKSGTLRN